MSRISVVVSTIAVTVLMASSPTAAQPVEFTIPIDTVVNQPPGSITLLGTFDVPPDRQGLPCNAEALNQESVHPDNDLILESGGATAVIADVEATPDAVTPSTTSLVLGPTLSVSVRMGPDGVFSGGVLITVGCPEEPTATTTPPTTDTTVAPTTPAPATVAPSTAAPATTPPTTAPSVASAPIIPETGPAASGPLLVAGLALVVAGGLLLKLVELHRRT